MLTSVFHFADEFDAYIIVSFVNATLVLSIGETVEEVTDSGFLGTTPTLSCSLLGEDALVQASNVASPRLLYADVNASHSLSDSPYTLSCTRFAFKLHLYNKIYMFRQVLQIIHVHPLSSHTVCNWL